MEVIVSSKLLATSQAEEFKPHFVISIADPDDDHPVFVAGTKVLSLDFHDICFLSESSQFNEKYNIPSREDVARIYEFAKSFDEDSRILIHCYAGISRSSAAAIISLCAHMSPKDAVEKIASLKTKTYMSYYEKGDIWFAPNHLMINYADEMLNLNGELMDCVEQRFSGGR
jgi:predicted protein tyrosine phosphatase